MILIEKSKLDTAFIIHSAGRVWSRVFPFLSECKPEIKYLVFESVIFLMEVSCRYSFEADLKLQSQNY